MSNKQKFLTVLATMIQPQASSPKRAWDETEKAFESNLALLKQFSHEELSELVIYTMMGMNQLSHVTKVDLFHEVINDDLRTILHDRTCEKCKGRKDAESDTDATPQQEDRTQHIRMFNSFEDLLESMKGGGKKPS